MPDADIVKVCYGGETFYGIEIDRVAADGDGPEIVLVKRYNEPGYRAGWYNHACIERLTSIQVVAELELLHDQLEILKPAANLGSLISDLPRNHALHKTDDGRWQVSHKGSMKPISATAEDALFQFAYQQKPQIDEVQI